MPQPTQRRTSGQRNGSNVHQAVSNPTNPAYPPSNPIGNPNLGTTPQLKWLLNPLDYLLIVWQDFVCELSELRIYPIVTYQSWLELRNTLFDRIERLQPINAPAHYPVVPIFRQRSDAEAYQLGWNPECLDLLADHTIPE